MTSGAGSGGIGVGFATLKPGKGVGIGVRRTVSFRPEVPPAVSLAASA